MLHAIGSSSSSDPSHATIVSELGILASRPFTCDVMSAGCFGNGRTDPVQEQSSLQSVGSSITIKPYRP